METENRSILIVFCIVILLIFLDHQSHRQLQLTGLEPAKQIDKIEKASLESLTTAKDELESRTDWNQPAIDKLSDGDIAKKADSAAQDVVDTIKSKTSSLFQPAADLRNQNLKLKQVSFDDIDIETPGSSRQKPLLPVLPATGQGAATVTSVLLYFPGFRGKETRMTEVKRQIKGKVDPVDLLELLQAGPTVREKGLVNAFDESVSIQRFRIVDGVAEVDVSADVHKMSRPVRQDRLDQICITLFQFHEINSIRLSVDGKELTQLGTGKDAIVLKQPIQKVNRQIEKATSL